MLLATRGLLRTSPEINAPDGLFGCGQTNPIADLILFFFPAPSTRKFCVIRRSDHAPQAAIKGLSKDRELLRFCLYGTFFDHALMPEL